MSDAKIPLFKVYMSPLAHEWVKEVLYSGHIAQGKMVDRFEGELQKLLRIDADQEILTVNSCTSALDMALHLCGVGPGDEVITTAQTCTATNGGIVHRGARPVWADIHPITGLVDPKSVDSLLSPRTKAIMVVDWGGRPCDYDALHEIGDRHGVPVIQDAAHSFMTRYHGVPIGGRGGDYICWSFQAIKTLTTGDGGALLVPPGQTERARLLRWYGLDRRSSMSFRCAQNIQEIGYKYHMNDIAAAIGLANLRDMDDLIGAQRSHARLYCDALSGLRRVKVPFYDEGSSWFLYTISVDDRASFEKHMAERGIETSQAHARNDRHDAFAKAAGAQTQPRPGQDYFSEHQVSIPVGWWLATTPGALTRICDAVIEWDKL
jgi:dTDP-4-amino-4,6-dideoxygalactose transaminase